MKKYVVGFLVCEDTKNVLLIRKARPDWQRGKLNGVGGHIEPADDEHPHFTADLVAMVREFKEETGLGLGYDRWEHRVQMNAAGWSVAFFIARGTNGELHQAERNTKDRDERCESHSVSRLAQCEVLPNLRWLIPLCMDGDIRGPVEVFDDTRPV